MSHRLEPLLNPRSIAVVGATRRAGAVGNTVIRNLLTGGYGGRLAAVNPRYPDVEGVPCVARLADLPFVPEQVIFAVADTRIEAAVDDGIARGMRSCVIYSALVLAEDVNPPLQERVQRRLAAAGVLACGGNGMGYYNFSKSIWACGFETRRHRPGGNVTLISQSGAGMSGIVDVEARIDFNLAISPGQELTVTLEDYLDFALEQQETRVIGLFLETSRAPERLVAALRKARERRIPLVAVKTGRTALSQDFARTHSGALSGADDVYDALFDRYGVHRARDMDELAATLIMHAQPHPVRTGGLVTLHDSGGERQLLVDLAAAEGVPLAQLSADSRRSLEVLLDPGLSAVNPLDAWSAGGSDYHNRMSACFEVLMRDPAAALGAVVHDRGPDGRLYGVYLDYLRRGHAASGKPVFLVSATQGTGSDPLVLESTRAGFPVLDGVAKFLRGARALLGYREFLDRPEPEPPAPPAGVIARWRRRLASGTPVPEWEALQCVADFGVPAVTAFPCNSLDEALARAARIGYPVVLKTAGSGIAHKSDARGVYIRLEDAEAVGEAYSDLNRRVGPEVVISSHVPDPVVEMILGMRCDPQFGPVVVIGFGGIHAEVLRDAVTVIPPFDAATVCRALDRLRTRALLDGARGAPVSDIGAFSRAAAAFSVMAVALGDRVATLDLNPVRVQPQGCLAVDALLEPLAAVSGNLNNCRTRANPETR